MKGKTVEVATGKISRFETLVRDAARLEVEDAFFNTGSAVFLPDVPGSVVPGLAIPTPFTNAELLAALELSHPEFTADLITKPFEPDAPANNDPPARDDALHVILAALRFLEKNPAHQLLIAGHTDRAGDDAFNVRLSTARGKSVLAVLEGKREDFVAACKTFHAPEDDPIVLRYAARTHAFQTEPVDSRRAEPSEIREFQKEFNEKFKASIRVNGIVGDDTRGAYFDLYQRDLEKSAGGKDALAKLRTHIRFVDGAHKIVGFGERFPRDNPAQDGLRSQANRRVEFLFFAPPRLPTVSAPDVGEQLFRRKLFTFVPLDRDKLALTDRVGDSAPTRQTRLTIAAATLVPDDELTTSMPKAGVRDPNDPWGFLVQFDALHPDEGIIPRRRNINQIDLGNKPPAPPPPNPFPNS